MTLHKEINREEQYAYYTVERRPEVIAKMALDPLEPRQAERLSALVAARTGPLEDISTWPITTLHDAAGTPLGFMMLRVDRHEYREVRELYHPARVTPRSWPERIRVAARIAQAFQILHGAGQVIGNVNGRDLLVSPREHVRLVNVDSHQATGARVIPSLPALPDFTPPELQGKGHLVEHTQNHDLFGLAVLVFRLVMDGQHPYSGVPVNGPMPGPGEAIAADLFAYSRQPRPGVRRPPGTPSLDTLSARVQELFERAFSTSHEHRPTAREWHAALTDMAGSLEPCQSNPTHLRVPGQTCPQCQQEQPRAGDQVTFASTLAEQRKTLETLWQKVQAVPTPQKPASTSAPELPRSLELPPLPLNLPAAPRSLLSSQAVENTLRWLIRVAVLVAIFSVVYAIQKSFLSAFVIVGLVVLILTLGRRFSVDWDGMIVNFQNWEGRLVEQFLPTSKQVQTYYAAIETRRAEHRRAFKELRDQYTTLETEYRDRSAFARYQLALSSLDQRRRRLLQQEQQGDAMQNLVQEYRLEALHDYLKRQALHPGIVPELTSRVALHLSTMGVRRAFDVQPEKLKVVRPELSTELLAWRDDLMNFFQFNENSIPRARLAEAQQKQQMGQRSEFRQFEHDARKFLNTDWQAEEQEFLDQLQTLKAQAKQRQKALKALDDIAGK